MLCKGGGDGGGGRARCRHRTTAPTRNPPVAYRPMDCISAGHGRRYVVALMIHPFEGESTASDPHCTFSRLPDFPCTSTTASRSGVHGGGLFFLTFFHLLSPAPLLPRSTPRCTVLILGSLPSLPVPSSSAFSYTVDEFERERFSRPLSSQAETSLGPSCVPSTVLPSREAGELATAAAAVPVAADVAVVQFEGRGPHS